jgi:hypothetical protein
MGFTSHGFTLARLFFLSQALPFKFFSARGIRGFLSSRLLDGTYFP